MNQKAQRRSVLSPGGLLAACVLLCAAAFLWCTGSAWALALSTILLDGLLVTLWIVGATGFGAIALRLARIEPRSLALRFAASAACGLGIMSLVVLGMGLAGMLNRTAAIAMVVAGLVLFAFWIGRFAATRLSQPVSFSGWWLIAMPSLGIALACAMLPPGILWPDEPHWYDVVEYHLQVPREWYESGQIRPLDHNVFSYLPFNVEMHYLLAMHLRGGPWLGMYLCQLMHMGFVALSVIAVYGVLREMEAPHATVGAVAAGATPWMMLLAPIAYNEGGLLLFGTLAIGIAMLAMQSTAPLRMGALAGAMAGLAAGVKLTAGPLVLLAVPVGLIVVCRGRSAVKVALAFVFSGIVVAAPWLVRNQIWAGNPVFPQATAALGRGHFSEVQAQRWERAHSPRADQNTLSGRLKAGWKQVLSDWRYAYLLIPAGIMAGVAIRSPAAILLMTLMFLQAVFWLFFTHLQSRFFVLSIPISAVLLGLLPWRRGDIAVGALAIAMALLGLVQVHRIPGASGQRLQMNVFKLAGLTDLSIFTPIEESQANATDRVVLIGDARAFCYGSPRLSYRTVFDVDVHAGESIVDAWMRGVEMVPRKTLLVIDPLELVRFAESYYAIPAPPPDVAAQPRPYVVRK